MSTLREAAQQALEALEDMLGWQSLAPQTIQESAKGRAAALKDALAEEALQRLTDVQQEMQEPPCATRECMPSECPNCVSLQDQNTELDRKLAELSEKRNFCSRCGKRTNDLHTCTPPGAHHGPV